jgi:hypothetical protein
LVGYKRWIFIVSCATLVVLGVVYLVRGLIGWHG